MYGEDISIKQLYDAISELPADPVKPIEEYGCGCQTSYRSQWLAWLGCPHSKRKRKTGRTAEDVYDRIENPGMLLWLIEEAHRQESFIDLIGAREEAHRESTNYMKCMAIRDAVPWEEVANVLGVVEYLSEPDTPPTA
ncbi:MAG: hypothetical protein FWG78_00160 [Coriobacteriia bacterium]|nr:hypothetical protein [Coriobacteriia bacterium]